MVTDAVVVAKATNEISDQRCAVVSAVIDRPTDITMRIGANVQTQQRRTLPKGDALGSNRVIGKGKTRRHGGRLQAIARPGDAPPESGCPFHTSEEEGLQIGLEEVLEEGDVVTPGPRPLSVRSAWDVSKILRFGIHEAMLRFFQTYGSVCRFANPTNLNGKSGWLFVNDPDDVQYICTASAKNYTTRYLPDIYKFATDGKGILCSQGEYNRKHRAMCQPSFHSATLLKRFSEIVVDRSSQVAKWFTERETETDVTLVTQRLALDVIGEVAFSHDFKESEKIRKEIQGIESDYGEDTDALVRAVNDFGDVLGGMFILPMPVLKLLDRINFKSLRKLEQSMEIQRQIMLDVITKRRKELKTGAETRQDLLGSLLDVYDEDGNQMLDEELWEDVHDIMGAGHETTASTLAACLYLISVHPEVEEKIAHELRTVLGGRKPTYEDVESLVYTTQCVKETLRMYPPIPIFPREASAADQLPSGHRIDKGDVVFMAGYSLGRSAELWKDPLTFDPDRFRPELVAQMHKFQFCPFGAGNRMCIGPAFAMMSVTLMTATILQQLEFTAIYPADTALQITYDITMNFYKTDGLKMKIAPRYRQQMAATD